MTGRFCKCLTFPHRKKEKTPLATAVLVAASVAIAGFLLSMLSLLQIHGLTPYEGGSK
jgi:hypothetical protein